VCSAQRCCASVAPYVKEKGLPLPVTILLAHRYPLVREGLKTVLGSHKDLRVLGETGNGLDAITLVERLRPDVLIVDVRMPGLSGLEVTRQVCQRVPRTRVMVLSTYTHVAYVLEARRHGATGYVLKDDDVSELAERVRDVAAGRLTLSTSLAERLIAIQSHRAPPGVRDLYETLTTREREVLHLAAEGRTSTEMAAALGISPRTVETHRIHLMQKLGLRTQTELIRYALSRGILPMEM
jgi:two-component system, NarL family, response regulator NreC